MKKIIPILLAVAVAAGFAAAQTPGPKWEEMTAAEYIQAAKQAQGVCVLPFGLIDAHGPAGPLGTDVYNVRAAALLAVKSEYAVVFPTYYFGQAAVDQTQPGTVSYSRTAQLTMLNETTAEMARNGCTKVVIIAGEDSNLQLIRFWVQLFLDKPVKDYMVYAVLPIDNRVTGGGTPDTAWMAKPMPAAAAPSGAGVDGHGGENEISELLVSRPDLAHPERSGEASGADAKRLAVLGGKASNALTVYGRSPNSYSGNAARASRERGEALLSYRADAIVDALKAVKADKAGSALQKEFFEEISHPMDTKQ